MDAVADPRRAQVKDIRSQYARTPRSRKIKARKQIFGSALFLGQVFLREPARSQS